MPPRREITPALYGIMDWATDRLIRDKWDTLIVPILHDEEGIYKAVFDVFIFAQLRELNKKAGCRVVWTILRHKGFPFEFDEDEKNDPPEYKVILNEVLKVYWYLATNKRYWLSERYMQSDGLLVHGELIRRWRNDNENLIRRWEENLEWLNRKN